MVTIMPNNPWRCADFLERVRPGIAISAAIHVGLFVLLAYLLAFHSPMPTPPAPEETGLILIPPPVVQVKPHPPTHAPFHPNPTPTLANIDPHADVLRLPPEMTFDHSSEKPAVPTPQPVVIINPQPIYRGGLVYPDRAADLNREGYVDFDFVIEADGTVGNPVVVAEVPDGVGFAAAAKKAFPKWRFNPMMKDGHPVAAPARIRVTFKLS